MTASILSSNDLCTEIVIKIEHDRSMADFEDKLQDSLNEAGRIGVQKELEWLDTDGSPIILGDIRLTSKSKKELKIYESPWGAVKVKRFVYQTSKGGAIFCPLDQTARIIVASTRAMQEWLSTQPYEIIYSDSLLRPPDCVATLVT